MSKIGYENQYIIIDNEPKLISVKKLMIDSVKNNMKARVISGLMNLIIDETEYEVKIPYDNDIHIIKRVI